MHIEIQVALNFVISYLYNKLPRRRVNLFGEELDRALQRKFDGHWYPEKPFKGSAYRCLRAGTPLDPVIEHAARESGVDLADIRENLPDELSIWIDPGEVSFRVGEKGHVKILYADDGPSGSSSDDGGDKDSGRSFNPEAQCFKPIESVSAALAALSVAPSPATASNNNNNSGGESPTFSQGAYTSSPSPNSFNNNSATAHNNNNNNNSAPVATTAASAPTVAFTGGNKHLTPLTFTTATFAQTKFGSTKLKSSSKRSNRMSPTEFSNYIKQRAMLQQQQTGLFVGPASPQPQRPRSLSPADHQHFVLMAGAHQPQPPFSGLFDNSYLRDLMVVGGQQQPQQPQLGQGLGKFGDVTPSGDNSAPSPFLMTGINDNSKTLLDGINFNLNNMPYSSQHLLVAN